MNSEFEGKITTEAIRKFDIIFGSNKTKKIIEAEISDWRNMFKVESEHVSGKVYRVSIQYGLKPNIGVMIGDEGVLLVDSGHNLVADILKKEISKLTKLPIIKIINTHPHGDHVSANKSFPQINPVNFANLDKLTKNNELKYAKHKVQKTTGKITLSYYYFDFNDEQVQIIPMTGSHSLSDILIYFPQSKAVHMGDLLLTQSFPAIYSNIPKYLEILDTVLAFFPNDINYIGGHGRLYQKRDLIEYIEMLNTTIGIVRNEMKKGLTVKEMQKNDILKDWVEWGDFLSFLNKNSWIEYIFRSYSKK